VVGVIYLVTAAILFFFVPASLPAEARQHNAEMRADTGQADHPVRALLGTRLRAYGVLFREPALRSFVPAWLAVNAVVGLFGSLVQPLMMRGGNGVANPFPNQLLYGHFEPHEVSYLFAGFGLVFMAGIWIWSLLYARIRKTTVMLLASTGLFITCFALFFINNQRPFATDWNAFLWVPVLVGGLFLVSGFTPVALAYLAEISGARVEHRGAIMGLYSVFLALGQLIGSGLGGFFITWLNTGFNALILGIFILGIIAFFAVLWLRLKYGV
jgi:MFS family permease